NCLLPVFNLCLIYWLSTCIPAPPVAPERKCAFLASPRNTETARSAGNVSGGVQHCARTNCCMGFFQLEHGQARPDLLGCSAVGTSCPESSCHASKPTQNYVRCLCSSDYCNLNITWNDQRETHTHTHTHTHVSLFLIFLFIYFNIFILTALGAKICVSLLCLCLCMYVFIYACTFLSCICLLYIRISFLSFDPFLLQVVAYGHFACVWQGFFQGSLVALKVFPATLRQAFIKEKDVYLLHSMTHSGIAQFLGAGRMGKEFVLVLELATQGSLNKFLSTNVCNWASTLKLVQTLAQGLAYLHSDFNKNGVYKPVIAHCDLSSSNVLVKADGSCALCDFGCSMVLQCSRTHRQGGIQMGTLHYMSPEILEGCVNLSSGRCLLQGDVYSLGLLLWELLVCCSDLHSIVPVHVLPYEAELGPSPSLEDLLSLVSEQRVRPTIPLYWDTHCQGFSVQELLEDCWDHDPDARLTAQCTADRLASLPAELVLGKATFDA
uniref:Serine/threonine-protein kinase receptor n=1 Tax=Electrophorus electricus TaxID=8005 RepID=A0A4W4F505_ELEEL